MKSRILSIDINDKCVRYVYSVKQGKDYAISKCGTLDVAVDLAQEGSLFNAVYGLLVAQKLFPQELHFCISRSEVMLHQVVLPSLKKNELKQVIEAEIEKIPQFADSTYDYHYNAEPEKKDRVRVHYAAFLKKSLQNLLHDAKQLDVPSTRIELTPLNLAATLSQCAQVKDSDAVLVVDDHQIYFCVIDGDTYKLFYKLSIGTEQILSAENESQKERVLISWASELKRVIKSYTLENKQGQIGRIWMVWDKKRLPGLDQTLARNMGVKIETPDVKNLKGFIVEDNEALNPIYLLALTPIVCDVHQMREAFSQKHFYRYYKVEDYLKNSVAVGLVFLFIFGVMFTGINIHLHKQKKILMKEDIELQKRVQVLRADADELYKERSDYLALKERLFHQAMYVQALNRVSWSEVLAVISQEMPTELSLSAFSFNESGRATFKGAAYQMNSIAEMVRSIDNSKILEKGSFDYLREQAMDEKKVYNFGILAKLQEEKPVEEITAPKEETHDAK